MSSTEKRAPWLAILALGVAIVGVVTPILWDLFKERAIVELRETESVELVRKQGEVEGIKILYKQRQLDNLTRMTFVLSNKGTVSIKSEDLITPPTIKFAGRTEILEATIRSSFPRDIGATLLVEGENKEASLTFPLLNPGDNITLSILLADYDKDPYYTSARIVGLDSLTIEKNIDESTKSKKKRGWPVYVVAVFSLLSLFLALVACFLVASEWSLKKRIRSDEDVLPTGISKSDLIKWIKSNLEWTTEVERRPVINYTNGLQTEELSLEEREHVHSLIEKVSIGATPNLPVVVAFAVFGFIGLSYVVFVFL